MWLVNKINAAQPLILADVNKYIASNPHLFDPAAAAAASASAASSSSSSASPSSSSSSSSSPSSAAAELEASLPDSQQMQAADAVSLKQFSKAASAHYATQLTALEAVLQREAQADAPPPSESMGDDAVRESQRRNLAIGWQFVAREKNVDIYTKTEGTVQYCKGQSIEWLVQACVRGY
jgi:hypothetical protein